MLKSLMSKWRQKRGFTMTEVMVVVAIIAVVAAIAIPSAIAIRNSLQFQERNNYARSIFLAAQTELMEMRSSGELEKLKGKDPEALRQTTDESGTPPVGYVYAKTGTDTFALILPSGAIDETVRDDQIIIEYNANTGNIFAVFCYDGKEDIFAKYNDRQLSRQEDVRKKMKLGYYDGSDLADPDLGVYYVKADVSFENGHEGMVTVVVPAQARVSGGNINFMGDNYNAYANGLEVTLTVTGEQGGTFTKTIKTYGNADNCTVSSGEGGVNAIYVSFPMDSLADMGSFASLAENNVLTEGETEEARTLTAITDKNDFVILPGDNVSITAEVSFRPGMDDPMVIIESAAIAGVNPMFDSLTPGTNGYILAVSNGRNLQNLNAIAPEIAEKVEAVVFNPSALGKPAGTDPVNIIDWNDTVAYYNNKYGTGSTGYTNSSAEAPARALPYFVPIHNEYLFGTVTFQKDDGGNVPMWAEVHNRANNAANADIVGNNVRIYNLNVDTARNVTNKAFYAGSDGAANNRLAGLFGYINTNIDSVFVANPVIRGAQLATDGQAYPSAAGALVGVAGKDTYISNCGAYIDTTAADFVRTNLNMGSFTGIDNQYGVSGYGAVGGLVGYIKSDQIDIKTVTGSYGAVPVFANMHMGTNCGYYNGVGGFVGNAQMVSFSDCYASGYVGTTNCAALPIRISKNTLGIEHSGSDSTGAGGFAGTSHASQYYNCFATGNVRGNSDSTGAFVGVLCYDSALGGRRAYLLDCYAVGDTFNTANFESFSGVHAVIKSNSVNAFEVQNSESTADHNITPNTQFSVNCYYLSQYDDNVSEKSNDATKYCAKPQTYNNLKAIRWNSAQASAETTHSYDLQAQNAVYPFAIQNATTHYYGSWPAQKADVGIAYYEFYSSEENAVPGYYFDRQSTATLKNQTVINDGYLVLSASTITKLTVNGESITIPTSKQVTLGNDAYNAYVLPLDKISEEGFYTTVVAETGIKNQDNSTTPVTATMYFNPNVALSQVNGATTAPKDAPSTIYVRSARQLAALGSESIQNLTDKSFIQQLDIDFSIAKDVTLSGNSVVSTFGKNTYNGDRHTITGTEMTIFGTNNGRILNCTVIGSADKKLATTVNGFVATNDGTIQNCSITGPGSISGAGFVTTNSGTIENCYVTPVAKGTGYPGKSNAELSISGCGFATTNSGTIKNCYALGTVNGSAGFVETNEGTIENCKANVNMSGDGKYAFVKTNNGEVKTSYGWVTGSATLTTRGAKGCYFALMNSEENAILYNAEGKSENCSLDELAEPSALTALGAGWNAAKSNNAYPYKKGLTQYPFPMIGNHYGDWTTGGGSLSYGVLYYEKYSNGYWYVDKVNLSAYDDMPYEGDETTTNLERSDIVQNAGYVFYCRAGKTPFDSVSNNLMGQVTEISGLHQQADLSTRYSFYPIDVTKMGTNQVTVTVTGATKDNSAVKSVSFTPFFADTLPGADKDLIKYKIRTQAQLENISRASVEAFVIDRSVKIDASYTAIPEFTGKLTSNGGQIHASNVKTGIIGTMLGESSLIDGVAVYIDNTESALFSGTKGVFVNVLKNGTIQNCTNVTANVMVNATGSDNVGILVGEMQGGKIDNCIINGSLGFKVSGSAKVGGVVGRVLGGTISNVTSNTTVAVGGTTDDVGLFVGAADGGTFTNCKTTAANTNLHFAGAFDKVTETVEGASHYSIKEKLADGIYESTSRFTEGNSCTKPVNAKFTQCAFKLNNADDLVLVTQDYHFYKIEKVGGYDAKQQEKSAAFSNLTANPAYSSFSETVTTDWVATRYFANIDGEYYRLSVMVTVKTEDEQETPVTQAEGDADTDENTGNEGNQPDNGGNTGDRDNESGTGETEQKPVTYVYQFRYNVGDTAVVSDAVEVTDLGATSVITFGEKTPKICIVSSLPSTGTFMLVNYKNEILTFNKNGNIEWIAYTEGNPVTTDGMIWSAGEVWNNQLKNVIKESRTTVTEDNVTTVTSTKSEFNLTAQVTRDENCPQKNGYLSVKVNYTITEKITTTVTIGDGAPDVTEDSKRISEERYLYLYILTENTDSLVTHVDTREGLTLTGLENAQNTESVQAAAETAAPVKETETSTAPDGAAEVPGDGNDETEH